MINQYRVVNVDSFHALQTRVEPLADRLFGDLFFNDVLELFAGQQLFQLQRLADIDRAVGQHTAIKSRTKMNHNLTDLQLQLEIL